MSAHFYFSPKCTLFGYGVMPELAREISLRGMSRALIVTDTELVKLGIAEKVISALSAEGIGYAVWDGIQPNPTHGSVYAALDAYRENQCDFFLSIGGGSAHDCAKCASILATNGGKIEDYAGLDKSRVTPAPLVAVNTTAGTASECTRAFVITNEETQSKTGSRDRDVLPVISVDDHELMMKLPRGLTAGTGMDALTHAVESYTSAQAFCMTRALAVAAVKLIVANLPEAVEGQTERSREAMATGQYLAGLAFGNAGVGLVHSMSHQLSAVYNLPHGLCNAILLPAVLKLNCRNERAQELMAELAREVFPLEAEERGGVADRAALLIEKVEELSARVGTLVPLADLGVRSEDLERLADKTLVDGSYGNNPVKATKQEVMELYRSLL